MVLPPDKPHACEERLSAPWTIHWGQVTGALLPDYLEALTVVPSRPVRHIGDDLQCARLFSEVLESLRRGASFPDLILASNALAYWLSLLIQKRRENPRANSDAVSKVAETIIYMSDHLHVPLRVPALARKDGALKLHPREIPCLDRLQKTVEALPSKESEFIGEMMGEVDTTKFVAKDYEVG